MRLVFAATACLLHLAPAAHAAEPAPDFSPDDLRTNERTAPAVVRSKARLALRSVLATPVSHAPLSDGERFGKGDLLVRFDCSTLAAERAAAEAAEAAEALDVATKRKLLRHGAAGKGELRRARALHRRASAQRKAIAARMKSCAIHAPFAGRVVRVGSKPGEVPNAGEPVLTIIDDRRLDLEIVAPSRWLAWARPGAAFAFDVEETGAVLRGQLTAIGPEVDPVSRTVRLFGAIEAGEAVLPGMSGRVRFEPRP